MESHHVVRETVFKSYDKLTDEIEITEIDLKIFGLYLEHQQRKGCKIDDSGCGSHGIGGDNKNRGRAE